MPFSIFLYKISFIKLFLYYIDYIQFSFDFEYIHRIYNLLDTKYNSLLFSLFHIFYFLFFCIVLKNSLFCYFLANCFFFEYFFINKWSVNNSFVSFILFILFILFLANKFQQFKRNLNDCLWNLLSFKDFIILEGKFDIIYDYICFNDSFQIQLLKFSIADHLFTIINYVISVLLRLRNIDMYS